MRPDDRYYTKTHEWVKQNGEIASIGITDFAVQALSNGNEADLVYCDLPEVGRILEVGDTFGEIESVKAVSDLNAPISGEVIETNGHIVGQPALVNDDAEGKAWFFKLKVADEKELAGLMDRAAYEAFVKESA